MQQATGAASEPYTFVRNTTSSGYGSLSNGTLQAISTNEYTSQAALYGSEHSSKSSLDLTIAETPVFPDDTQDGTNYSSWTFPVVPAGCALNSAQSPCDLTAALQTAINTATSTVVIPWGWYGLSSPLVVTRVDLLVSDSRSRQTVSLQVKLSKDFLYMMKPIFQDKDSQLRTCGWWTINGEKLKKSAADFWVFVLLDAPRLAAPIPPPAG